MLCKDMWHMHVSIDEWDEVNTVDLLSSRISAYGLVHVCQRNRMHQIHFMPSKQSAVQLLAH